MPYTDCRLYATALSRSQVFILGLSWYQAILMFSENYFLKPYRLFQSSHRPKGDFFKIHTYIREFYYQILYTFQSSCKLILIFSESYYQTIHTFQSSYIPILIFSESYYPTKNIFHSSNKPLLTNKTILSQSSYRT